jgi:hypothetical protein
MDYILLGRINMLKDNFAEMAEATQSEKEAFDESWDLKTCLAAGVLTLGFVWHIAAAATGYRDTSDTKRRMDAYVEKQVASLTQPLERLLPPDVAKAVAQILATTSNACYPVPRFRAALLPEHKP